MHGLHLLWRLRSSIQHPAAAAAEASAGGTAVAAVVVAGNADRASHQHNTLHLPLLHDCASGHHCVQPHCCAQR